MPLPRLFMPILFGLCLAVSQAAAQGPAAKAVQPFDWDRGVILYGRIEALEFSARPPVIVIRASAIQLQGADQAAPDTRTYRVEGGSLMLVPEHRPLIVTGAQVSVRGYLTRDRRCERACRMQGRDVTFIADGCRVLITNGSRGTAPPRDYRCPARAKALGLPPYKEEWGYSP